SPSPPDPLELEVLELAWSDGFPRFNFALFVFAFRFSFARGGAHSARRRRGCARGREALATPGPPCPGHPPRLLINPTQKYLGPKNPEGPRICYCFACLQPHRLCRFLAGDHYGKGKSIRDDR